MVKEKRGSYMHPLLRELEISPATASSPRNTTTIDSATISSSYLLSYLLDTNRLEEKTVRDAVRSIQQQASLIKDNIQHSNDTPESKHQHGIRTRHVALQFFYDGASYSGLAQNIGDEKDNSVERKLFDALVKARLVVSRDSSGYSRCGRTDRGVSACAQVVALNLKSSFSATASWNDDGTSLLENNDLPKNEHESRKVWIIPRSSKLKKEKKATPTTITTSTEHFSREVRVQKEMKEYSYSRILNNILPPTIRILGWTPVTEQFSARFSATVRTYRYFFCMRQMHMESIRTCLSLLVGKHDFRNFCKMDIEKVYNFERVIRSAELIKQASSPPPSSSSSSSKDDGIGEEVWYLQITGQAFLWHQIRCIAEVVFMIGRGEELPSIISELLDVNKNPGKPSYGLADERSLVLQGCDYANLQFGYSIQNLFIVSGQLEKQWEEHILAAARLRNAIDSFRKISILKDDLIAFINTKLNDRLKKLQRREAKCRSGSSINHKSCFLDRTKIIQSIIAVDDKSLGPSNILSWKNCLSLLKERNFCPCSDRVTNSVHVPLMERSVAPTYEMKVESIKGKSEKRRLKFETNIIKKRKTVKEDKAFYDHKIKQGGSGI